MSNVIRHRTKGGAPAGVRLAEPSVETGVQGFPVLVTPEQGQVKVEHPAWGPQTWYALPPAEARKLADALNRAADRAATLILVGGN